MRFKHTRLIAVMLALCVFLSVGAAAGIDEPEVRVNGRLVSFADVGPYTDLRGRVMVPVRFVAESLGAEVTWNGETRTACIQKDGVLLEVPIGCRSIRVTWGGMTTALEMDTEAVLYRDRTMVPIRSVAEALGAYVDYADRYNTVSVWKETLRPEEIVLLHSLPYTQPDHAVSYAEAQDRFAPEDLLAYYGEDRDSFGDFANAREYLYRGIDRWGSYRFPALGAEASIDRAEDLYPLVAAEAAAELGMDSPRLTVSFLTDESCLYQADAISGLTTAVRGIAVVSLHVSPLELTVEETALLCSLGIGQITEGDTLRMAVDVHMNTRPGYLVNVHTLVPLGEAD